MAARLEELNVTAEELERFRKAFQDEQFRKMFAEYAEELSDPENRRKYEEEIRLLEREKGMDIHFIHPNPGYVLLTSASGTKQCYINICSNPFIPKSKGVPGTDRRARGGLHWTLPYTITPTRQELDKGGGSYLLYDIVFHPDTLGLAAKNARFKELVDSTAMDGVTKYFHLQLDRNNVQTLKIKYKGVPQTGVVRRPIPGYTAKPEDPDDPICFPYPYPPQGGAVTEESRADEKTPAPEEDRPPSNPQEAATIPHYTITHRSYVDFQDYTQSRYSAPSPVPKELVIAVDLPLLDSATGVVLHILSKQLNLECKQPAYKLQAPLPYSVDETQGRAKFNKAKRQLVLTLPVIQQDTQRLMQDQMLQDGDHGCGAEERGVGDGQADPICNQCGHSNSPQVPFSTVTETLPRYCQQSQTSAADPHTLIMPPDALLCPTFTCTQDATSLTLIIHVKDIDKKSIFANVEINQFQVRFRVKHEYICYFLLIQFLPKYSLNRNEISINVSENNVVVELTKSSENFGLWKNLYFGDSTNPLQERRFVSEDNVTEFLESGSQASQIPWSTLEDELMLEVMELNDQKTHIRLNKPEGEDSADPAEIKHSPSSELDSLVPADTCPTEEDESPKSQSPSEEHVRDTAAGPISSIAHSEPICDAASDVQSIETVRIESKVPCPVETAEAVLDETGQSTSDECGLSPVLTEISTENGHKEVITDHTTQCAFTFQNPLLYDLD
ncbi:protein kintoun [Pelodytes ibericus]